MPKYKTLYKSKLVEIELIKDLNFFALPLICFDRWGRNEIALGVGLAFWCVTITFKKRK